jgi:hypothetical protein
MKEDYLWDKSGEPDAEIAELERNLGRLRYKRPAEPLPLPATSRAGWFRPAFSPAFAIAATLVILLLAGGLWLGLRRAQRNGENNMALINKAASINNAASANKAQETTQPQPIASGPAHPVGPVNPDGNNLVIKDEKRPVVIQTSMPRRAIHHPTSESAQKMMAQAAVINNRRARQEEIARGQEAKAQLIKALLITSDKLNAVQKKIQGTPERNPIS